MGGSSLVVDDCREDADALSILIKSRVRASWIDIALVNLDEAGGHPVAGHVPADI
jgi:hypothetical protein